MTLQGKLVWQKQWLLGNRPARCTPKKLSPSRAKYWIQKTLCWLVDTSQSRFLGLCALGCALGAGVSESHLIQDGGQDEDPPSTDIPTDLVPAETIQLLLQLLHPRPRHSLRCLNQSGHLLHPSHQPTRRVHFQHVSAYWSINVLWLVNGLGQSIGL